MRAVSESWFKQSLCKTRQTGKHEPTLGTLAHALNRVYPDLPSYAAFYPAWSLHYRDPSPRMSVRVEAPEVCISQSRVRDPKKTNWQKMALSRGWRLVAARWRWGIELVWWMWSSQGEGGVWDSQSRLVDGVVGSRFGASELAVANTIQSQEGFLWCCVRDDDIPRYYYLLYPSPSQNHGLRNSFVSSPYVHTRIPISAGPPAVPASPATNKNHKPASRKQDGAKEGIPPREEPAPGLDLTSLM